MCIMSKSDGRYMSDKNIYVRDKTKIWSIRLLYENKLHHIPHPHVHIFSPIMCSMVFSANVI